MELLLLSFIAGVLTILAPCVVSVLPILLARSASSKDSRSPLAVILGLAGSIIIFTTFEHIHLRREMRRNYERTLIPVIRSVKHISTCGESPELNHGAHF